MCTWVCKGFETRLLPQEGAGVLGGANRQPAPFMQHNDEIGSNIAVGIHTQRPTVGIDLTYDVLFIP